VEESMKIYNYTVLNLTLALSLTGCFVSSGGGSSGGGSVVIPRPSDPPTEVVYTLYEEENLSSEIPAACNPFENGANLPRRTQGLYGELSAFHVRRDDSGQITNFDVDELRNLTTDHYFGRSPQNELAATPVRSLQLFFNKLDVPTRPFNRGFITQDGRVLKVSETESTPLYEYFGINFETQLRLPQGKPTGWYQLSILSDDGTIVYLKKNGNGEYVPDIFNDGRHANRIRCGSTFYLDSQTRIPLKVEFFQGPRYYIALQLLWRYIGENNVAPPDEPECSYENQPGDSNRYFDADNDAAPTDVYRSFLSRGWSVVPEDAFELPEFITSNPCSQQWPPAGRQCYTETWQGTLSSQFQLAKSNPDAATLRVFLNNRRTTSIQYLPNSNSVKINEPVPAGSDVKIQYCLSLSCGRDCGLIGE
jgi:hypothetical protein